MVFLVADADLVVVILTQWSHAMAIRAAISHHYIRKVETMNIRYFKLPEGQ
jgi:hypothetical protein